MIEFLEKHGWTQMEEGYEGLVEHPLFPLAQDISTDKSLSEFVNDFYEKSWRTYKCLIDSYANQEKKE